MKRILRAALPLAHRALCAAAILRRSAADMVWPVRIRGEFPPDDVIALATAANIEIFFQPSEKFAAPKSFDDSQYQIKETGKIPQWFGCKSNNRNQSNLWYVSCSQKSTEESSMKLNEITRIGKSVRRRVKGDFSDKPIIEDVGVVEDVVSAGDGENMYFLELIKKMSNAGFLVRAMYFTMESRPRGGCNEARVGYGQYAPIMPVGIFGALLRQAKKKKWPI